MLTTVENILQSRGSGAAAAFTAKLEALGFLHPSVVENVAEATALLAEKRSSRDFQR
jgi:hypothetical protein